MIRIMKKNKEKREMKNFKKLKNGKNKNKDLQVSCY